MSGSKTATKGKKQVKNARKPAAKPFKRAASIVELHMFPGRMMLVSLRGKLGHPARALAQFDDDKLVGALENGADMRDIVLQTGAAVLATMTNYPIGTDGSSIRGLMEALVKLAGIDVEALKEAAHLEEKEMARAEVEQDKAMQYEAALAQNPENFEEEADFAEWEAGPVGGES